MGVAAMMYPFWKAVLKALTLAKMPCCADEHFVGSFDIINLNTPNEMIMPVCNCAWSGNAYKLSDYVWAIQQLSQHLVHNHDMIV
jgi:hypothetical protein